MFVKKKTTIFITILSILIFLFGSITLSFITEKNIGLFSTFSANAEELGYTYEIENNEITITGHTNPTGDLTIPQTIDGLKVTRIGDHAFANCGQVTGITLPEGIVDIGDHAFTLCVGLEKVSMPDTVLSIGENTFVGCESLKNVSLSKNITSIEMWSFAGCRNLVSIIIPAGVESIGKYAFAECDNLAVINIPNRVSSIGFSAFLNCSKLSSLSIPNSVTNIGNFAFSGCENITSISLSQYVTNIGQAVFYRCLKLSEIAVDPANREYISKDGVLFNKTKTRLIQYPAGSATSAYQIPSGVKEIDDFAFYGCSGLISVSIPQGVTSIGSKMFAHCNNLENIVIPDCITSIDNDAFYCCSSLKKILIPDSVTSISESAFSNCSSLEKIIIPNSVTYIGKSAFSNCSSLKNILIPDSVTSINESAFSSCSGLKNILIPCSVTSINESAFSNCSSIKYTTIPASVTNIGDSAFINCDCLLDVYYAGTEEEWNTVVIYRNGNEKLLAAQIHFNSSGPAPRFTILNDTDVELTYEQGCFGDNDGTVSAKINKLQTEQETSGAIRLKANGERLIQAGMYSIKIYDKSQNEVQPQNDMKVTIKLPIPESFSNFEDFTVVHWYGNGGAYEKFRVSKNQAKIENGYLIFETGRFSEFAICIDDIFASEAQTLAYRVTKQITNYPSAGNIKYSSSDESVATVDGNGCIKAVGVGSATITASIDGTDYKESTEVRVAYAWWQWLIRIFLLGFIWY